MRRVPVQLSASDRQAVDALRSRGSHLAREVNRAHILAALHQGLADQQISAATAYVTNSNIAVPAGKLRIGTVLRWRLAVTKSAAGTTAGCAVLLKIGTLGTTGDATILTFTLGTPTGAADTGYISVDVVIRGPLSASCIATGICQLTHNLASTGFSNIACEAKQATSAGFDATVANLICGLTITTTTASVWTVTSVIAEAKNL